MKLLACFVLSFFLSACAASDLLKVGDAGTSEKPSIDLKSLPRLENIPKRIIGALVDPILNLTEADAKSTLKAIDDCKAAIAKDPTAASNPLTCVIDPARETEARKCPNDILALSSFRQSLDKLDPGTEEGTRLLIYYGTVNRYGNRGGLGARGKALSLAIVASCGQLIPDNRFAPISGAFGG